MQSKSLLSLVPFLQRLLYKDSLDKKMRLKSLLSVIEASKKTKRRVGDNKNPSFRVNYVCIIKIKTYLFYFILFFELPWPLYWAFAWGLASRGLFWRISHTHTDILTPWAPVGAKNIHIHVYRIAFIINITAKHYVDGHNGYPDYKSNLLWCLFPCI